MKKIHPHGLTFEDALKHCDRELAQRLLKYNSPAKQEKLNRRWKGAWHDSLLPEEDEDEQPDTSPGRNFDEAAFQRLVQDAEAVGIHVPTDEECRGKNCRHLNRPMAMLKALMNAKQDALLERLLQAGLDLNKSMYNFTDGEAWPLSFACHHHPRLVPLLLRYGANPNGDKRESIPLVEAIFGGDLNLVELLLSAGANPDVVVYDWNFCPLDQAIDAEMYELAYRFLEMGADPNGGGDDAAHLPLTTAIYHCHVDMVDRLLDAGASPFVIALNSAYAENSGQTPLFHAEEEVRWLGKHPEEGKKALENAKRIRENIYKRFPDIDRLEIPDDWEEENEQKHAYMNAALWNAAAYGLRADVQALLEYCGADASACNKAGVPALAVAAQRGHAGVVYGLLSYGADPATAAPMPTARQAFTAEVRRLLKVFEGGFAKKSRIGVQ